MIEPCGVPSVLQFDSELVLALSLTVYLGSEVSTLQGFSLVARRSTLLSLILDAMAMALTNVPARQLQHGRPAADIVTRHDT